MSRPRLLMLGGYPLDRLDAAPKVRITRMREAFEGLCDLTFLSDTREGRRKPLLALLPRIRQFDAVYVEAATSTATETDLLFYSLCRRLGIPLGIYVRDAYPLYDYQYDAKPLKHRLLKLAWQVSIHWYQREASALYFPTHGLSLHFHHPRKLLLPPGGRLHPGADRSAPEARIVYVGGVSQVLGSDLLMQAMERVVERLPEAKLSFICAPGAHDLIAPWRDRPWLELKHLETDALLPEMNRAAVAVIPFRQADYPALPVKLLDYLSYRMPVVATPWSDVVAFIAKHHCGHVVEASPEAVADGLIRVLLDPEEARRLSAAAGAAIAAGNSWDDRARTVLETLLSGSSRSAKERHPFGESPS